MFFAVLLAQLATATPAATPAPGPEIRSGTTKVSGAPRTLADIARERKGKPKPTGAASAAGSTVSGYGASVSIAAEEEGPAKRDTREAQERMNRAAERGLWVHENIRYNDQMKDAARREWDEAALMCHKIPGCRAIDRDQRIIPTDEYLIEEERKRLRLSK